MRLDEDSLGQVTMPEHAYYGVQTALLTAIAQVKKAAALANLDIGVLREPVARAICQAAEEIIDGTLGPEQFPVDVLLVGGIRRTARPPRATRRRATGVTTAVPHDKH